MKIEVIGSGCKKCKSLTLNDKPILVGSLPDKERLKEIISKNI